MIYLANDCFTEANRLYNEHLARKIRNYIPKDETLYLPQENTKINDKTQYANSVAIVEGDNEILDRTDLLIVVLDNLESGAGRCAEIGYAAAKGINMIGLWTDTRQQGADNQEKIEALKNEIAENQFAYINLYVIGLIKQHGVVVNGVDELIEELDNYYPTTQHEPSLIEKVEQWGRDKGITNPKAQMTKVLEEVTELNSAMFEDDEEEIIDAIGDVQVTLIILLNTLGKQLHEISEIGESKINRSFNKEKDLVTLFNETIALNELINDEFSMKEKKNNIISDALNILNFVRYIACSNGYGPSFCLQTAYDVISKRTGKLVNGVFVKDD